jgi:hypothetical protein
MFAACRSLYPKRFCGPAWGPVKNSVLGTESGINWYYGDSTVPDDKSGERVIYCRFIRRRDGRLLDAHAYGKKVFRFILRDKKRPK